jgi:acetyl-CoA acetyltransferase family protein
MFGIGKYYGPGILFGQYAESGLATSLNALDPRRAGMAPTAQNVSNLCGITRGDADALAVLSHQRALAGRERMGLEIAPFFIAGELISQDEGPRETTLERVAKLPALPDTGGLVTAANASSMGACGVAVVLASEEMALRLGATILAEVVGFGARGFRAEVMGLGPVPTVETLLSRLNLKPDDIGYWEINEAFAHIWAAIMKSLKIDVQKSNLYGGGISIGHQLGPTGARLLGMIAREVYLRRDEPGMEYALATLCGAGGRAAAVVVRRHVPALDMPSDVAAAETKLGDGPVAEERLIRRSWGSREMDLDRQDDEPLVGRPISAEALIAILSSFHCANATTVDEHNGK